MIRRFSSGFWAKTCGAVIAAIIRQEATESIRIDPGADSALIEDRTVDLAVADHAADR